MTKKDHELAVDEFVQADTRYREIEEKLLDGTLAFEVSVAAAGRPDYFKDRWQQAIAAVQTALEDRNVKAKAAVHALRQAVQLAPSQWRGPDGKSTVLNYGPASVSSVTSRSFDCESLLVQLQKKGLLERALQLSFTTKDGKEQRAFRQEWIVEYEPMLKWLKQNNFDDVVQAAYDEKEKTPQVKGLKPLTFVGETKGD